MQIEEILEGKTVICEICGSEFSPNIQDFRDVIPAKGMEPQNLFRPEDLKNLFRPDMQPRRDDKRKHPSPPAPPLIHIDDNHPRINENNILANLVPNEWITLRKLANKIEILDAREFYILRMKLNEMSRNKLIQMEFQINKVLIRRFA